MAEHLDPALSIIADPAYPRLKQWIIDAVGLAFFADRDQLLEERIRRRLDALGVRDCALYLARLASPGDGERELDALVAELTVGETHFFRHIEQLDAIRETVLPALIDCNAPARRLRIWSAGCSIGAEPYTLAIYLRRAFGERIRDWDVHILATDINRRFLAQAQTARYGAWSLRSTPEAVRRDCFVQDGEHWLLRQEYRAGVTFQYHNLVRHPFPSPAHGIAEFDLILCRNVLIYFEQETAGRVIEQFRRALVDGGWLVVGHSDWNAGALERFEAVRRGGMILYRKGPERDRAAGLPAPARAGAPATPELPPPPRVRPSRPGPAVPPPAGQDMTAPALEELRCLADAGRWDEAERHARALLERLPLDAGVRYHLALIREQQGDFGEAERLLRQAIYLARHFAAAHYHLGLLLQHRRRAVDAARCFKNVLRLVERQAPAAVLDHGDGLTAGELGELARLHLARVAHP